MGVVWYSLASEEQILPRSVHPCLAVLVWRSIHQRLQKPEKNSGNVTPQQGRRGVIFRAETPVFAVFVRF